MEHQFFPSWETAPEWAQFRALDRHGWCWYENEPIYSSEDEEWLPISGRSAYAIGSDLTICEPRPKPKRYATEQTTPEQK